MPRTKTPKRYRLSDQSIAIIEAVAALKEWTATSVVEHALADYGKRVLGRRMADLVGVKLRDAAGREGRP